MDASCYWFNRFMLTLLRRCCRKNKSSHAWYTRLIALTAQPHCRSIVRDSRTGSSLSVVPLQLGIALWLFGVAGFSQRCAVFTHGPVFPLCICPVIVLPFRLGHMIYCPLRAHYLTSVLQQQRDHPQSIKRNSTQAGMYAGSFAPTICSGGKKKTWRNYHQRGH